MLSGTAAALAIPGPHLVFVTASWRSGSPSPDGRVTSISCKGMRIGRSLQRRSGWGVGPIDRVAPALVAAMMGLVVACGSNAGAPTKAAPTPATATPSAAATPSSAATVPPALVFKPVSLPTSAQIVAVGRAVFPHHPNVGDFEPCNNSYDVGACPFSAQLRAQIATYAANYPRVCPRGCAGEGLLTRSQCGSWSDESVTAKGFLDGSQYEEAIVELSGGSCDDTIFFIPVVMESGRLVATDMYCNDDFATFGMYNSNVKAVGGLSCSAT
jgi:hypothetical protein